MCLFLAGVPTGIPVREEDARVFTERFFVVALCSRGSAGDCDRGVCSGW